MGGLALTRLGGPLGSAFVGRAQTRWLVPFDLKSVRQLARPFWDDGRPLDDAVLEALYALSAGVPALVTYGLQQLWQQERPSPAHVARAFGGFARAHRPFLSQVEEAALGRPADPGSRDARTLLAAVRTARERLVPRDELLAALPEAQLGLHDLLPALRAAGLIRWDGIDDEPHFDVGPSGSPLLDRIESAAPSETPASLEIRLERDLEGLLHLLHRSSPDYFRQHDHIVPESVFSAFISAGLLLQGWADAQREPQQAAGRLDIWCQHPRHPGEHAVVEVKIWAATIAVTPTSKSLGIGRRPRLPRQWSSSSGRRRWPAGARST